MARRSGAEIESHIIYVWVCINSIWWNYIGRTPISRNNLKQPHIALESLEHSCKQSVVTGQ